MFLGDLALRRKVPLYIGAGLAIVIAAWTWLAYRNVRDAALSVGEQRLEIVTKQFATLYDSAARAAERNIGTAAKLGPIVDYVASHGARTSDSLQKLVKRIVTTQNNRVEFFATDGTPIGAFPDSQAVNTAERHEELSASFTAARRSPTSGAVAPFRILDGVVVQPVVAAVRQDTLPVGFIVVWKRVTATQQAREAASNLIGADARIYLGNTRGDLWADVGGAVHQFPPTVASDRGAAQYARDDTTQVLVSAKSIPGTPWSVAIEFADSAVLAPANQFLERSAIIGFIVLIIATAAAGLLSRSLTRPLHDLSEAAAAMSAGDYSRRVTTGRHDEIGQLSESFNVMASRVGDAQMALEGTVRERTTQLRERNEELEAFAHSISHDLRAPLRAMHGFSRALLDDCADQLDDAGKDYARRIAKASHHMDLLTQDLLSYSQVSRAEMSLGPVEMLATTQDALAQLEADIGSRSARVVILEPLPTVLGHRPAVQQTVANLVSNGLKFVPADRQPEIRIRAEQRNGAYRMWIEDNGIGIDPAHHERIFSVFERLHSNDQYAGTGIGLAIVRKAVERMGGRAGVESTLGSGSRFWFELQATET